VKVERNARNADKWSIVGERHPDPGRNSLIQALLAASTFSFRTVRISERNSDPDTVRGLMRDDADGVGILLRQEEAGIGRKVDLLLS